MCILMKKVEKTQNYLGKKSVFLSFITFLGDATSISADFSCSLKIEIKLHVIDSTKFRLTLRCECFK